MYNYDWNYWFWHMWGFGFFWIWQILFYVVIIFLVIYFINKISQKNERKNESALEILKKRYVNWEIDKDEFDEKKNDLLN